MDARLARFVDATRRITSRTGSATFTVQEVVAAAGLSLKSFYRCFRGKDDLLVALLGADSRVGAEVLRTMVGPEDDPQVRLQGYVEGIFTLATLPGAHGYAAVLVREYRRLRETHAAELERALEPFVALLAAEITRLGHPDPGPSARTLFELLLVGLHDVVVGRAPAPEVAAHLWSFCWSGLDPRARRDPGDASAAVRSGDEIGETP